MRKSLLYPIFLFSLLCVASVSRSQLAVGDIAFTGYNSTTSDNFSFVVLKTGGLPAGTVIKFTDRGWFGMPTNTCGTNSWATTVEEEITWTSAVAIPYGRQVAIQGLTATYPYGAAGTVTGTALNLSSGGDQIIAYTGTQAAATIIAAIQANYSIGITDAGANNWDNTGAVSPTGTQSNRPPCLTTGTHAIILTQDIGGGNRDEVDNGRLKGTTILSGNPATDRSRVNNIANWDVSDVSEFALPGVAAGLPVEFTWIKALDKSASSVSVEWGIGTEEEMKDYTIEKSTDGRSYTDVGVVAATGKPSYSWTDVSPVNGANYYRIRATEVSGISKYSTVAIVNRSKGGKGISVYPNVVSTQQFTLQVTNLPAGNYKLNLISATGQLVISRSISHAGGSSTQTVNLPGSINKGVYKINLTGDKSSAVTTIIVQ